MIQTQLNVKKKAKVGLIRPQHKMNALHLEIPCEMTIQLAEIRGSLYEGLTLDELYRRVAMKIKDVPVAHYVIERHGRKQDYLGSPFSIPMTEISINKKTFQILPSGTTVQINMRAPQDRTFLCELFRVDTRHQLKTLGFRKFRSSLIFAQGADFIKSQGIYNYHFFKGVVFRVYWYQRNSVLVVLDTLFHVVRSHIPEKVPLKTLKEQTWAVVSVEKLPKKIRLETMSIRKCSAQERFRRDKAILDQLSFLHLLPSNGKILEFEGRTIDEPAFFFGYPTRRVTLIPTQPLKDFLLTNLERYGPMRVNPWPEKVRVKVIRMAQIDDQEHLPKIQQGIQDLAATFERLYRIKLDYNQEIIKLPETEEDTEEYCVSLQNDFRDGKFDLVLAILEGTDYNHPFRAAIKKGLQRVPSQIIKRYKFNSPKILRDVYKTSILAQWIYKATGIIAAPIDTAFLNPFKIRIYYDLSPKILPNSFPSPRNKVSVVCTVAMVVEGKIYRYWKDARVNSGGNVEVIQGNFLRELIHQAFVEYLTEKHLQVVDGNILLQRDGIYGLDEPGPAMDEINKLAQEGIIPPTVNWAFVERIKSPPARLFSRDQSMEPSRGTLLILDETRAFLTTTGTPDIHISQHLSKEQRKEEDPDVGVARPLEVRLIQASGVDNPSIEIIAKDIYYRSFLWTASLDKTRLPIEANIVHEMADLCRQGVTQFPKWIC